MPRLRMGFFAGTALVAATSLSGAQGTVVPASQMPSAGMCRVWVSGVPAARQAAQTDCATARANAPANARILYGPQQNGLRVNDPRNAGYDPRRDPRSPSYDPRYDPRTGQEAGRRTCLDSNRDGICDDRQGERQDRRTEKQRRKWEKEREKDERKRDKQWNKSRKHGDGDDHDGDHHDGDDDDNDNDDRDHDRRRGHDDDEHGRRDRRGDATTACLDLNRDGVCDINQGNRRVRFP